MEPKTYADMLKSYSDTLDALEARTLEAIAAARQTQHGDRENAVEIFIFATAGDYAAADGPERYGVDWPTHCRLCGDLVFRLRRRGYEASLTVGDIDAATARHARQDALTRLRAARSRRDTARAEARNADEALRAATLDALAAGVPVKDAAREAGVSRQTIHKWRDKGAGHD